MRLPKAKIRKLFNEADNAPTNQHRGILLERAIRILFGSIPGVDVADQNVLHAGRTEEVDIVFWNERKPKGLYFLEVPFLAECKNWGSKVSGREIVYFANTMRGRCCRDGILIAAQGITGEPGKLIEAHYEIAVAARNGQRILVLTRAEIEQLSSVQGIVTLLKRKVLEVVISGTKCG